jgi:hypothetical protein
VIQYSPSRNLALTAMDKARRYWQLIRLTGSGSDRAEVLSQVQAWVQQTFATVLTQTGDSTADLQMVLMECWRSRAAEADLALLSLRCFVSHQIRDACLRLVQQFGQEYGFTAPELMAVVLDDDGRLTPPHRPFTVEILDSYDPTRAALSTWSSRLTCNHPELNRLLLEKGLYRVSDWAILNDTSPEQMQRILRTYHLCSEYEVAMATSLLEQYQQVYCRDRIAHRQAGGSRRCQPPTPEQLQEMNPAIPAKTLLAQLKHLASQLRQYRIHARSGNPVPYQTEPLAGEQPSNSTSLPDEQEEFLAAFHQAVEEGLADTIAQVVEANINHKKKKQPPEDWAYVQGLHRFHCLGQTLSHLANHLGFSNFAKVRRVLDLKRLRSDVRHRLLPTLYEVVRKEAMTYASAEQLHALDGVLEEILSETVDQVMAEASAEAQSPKRSGPTSLFAQRLCLTIHQFMPNSGVTS